MAGRLVNTADLRLVCIGCGGPLDPLPVVVSPEGEALVIYVRPCSERCGCQKAGRDPEPAAVAAGVEDAP